MTKGAYPSSFGMSIGAIGTSHWTKSNTREQRRSVDRTDEFPDCRQPTRTAVYGPVRTVVWQGSVGNRRSYADLADHPTVIADPGSTPLRSAK